MLDWHVLGCDRPIVTDRGRYFPECVHTLTLASISAAFQNQHLGIYDEVHCRGDRVD